MNWKQRASTDQIGFIPLPEHSVRVYRDRLAISRDDGRDMTWEETQAVKQEIWGDRVAIEVFPAEKDVVNFRPTRHLWWSPELEHVVRAECRHPEFFNE